MIWPSFVPIFIQWEIGENEGEIQGKRFMGLWVYGFMGLWVQGFRGSGVQGLRGS